MIYKLHDSLNVETLTASCLKCHFFVIIMPYFLFYDTKFPEVGSYTMLIQDVLPVIKIGYNSQLKIS